MSSRLARVVLVILLAPVAIAAQEASPPDLQTAIERLSAFDYSTRVSSARILRRAALADVVPALAQAVRGNADQFVRYRALIVLTGFNDRGTPDLMRALLADRNDRVREVAYRWFEQNADRRLIPTLLDALETEQAEFVRPALIRALAGLGADAQVQRALITEAGRGLDFFRSTVIEALGEHRATYAVAPLSAVAGIEGPLQDDAVLALGRIGGPGALTALSSLTSPAPDVVPAMQAAQCLLGDACEARIEWLAKDARSPTAPAGSVRAALAALSALAAHGHMAASCALVALSTDSSGRLRDQVALAFAAVALRRPADVIAWLAAAPDDGRARTIALLRQGFEGLEEDLAEEQFFAATRAAYWAAAEGSEARTVAAAIIDELEF